MDQDQEPVTRTMAARLAGLFTPTYTWIVNAQIVHPASSLVVKPNELESGLARPAQTAAYEPDSDPAYLAATLAFGIIQGHPFMDGNKRTGQHGLPPRDKRAETIFLANEYLRAQGLPGLVDRGEDVVEVADRHVAVAKGQLDVRGLSSSAGTAPIATR